MGEIRMIVQSNDGTNKKHELDLYPDTSLLLNYSIADIKNFGAKNSNYSKTITIPSSKENNKLFNHLFNINSFGGFDPNKYAPVWVVSNHVLIFTGNLELTSINTFDDGRHEYECLIFGGIADVTSAFNDAYLYGNDDWTYDIRMGVGHTVSNSNVINSYSSTQSYSYILPNLNDYDRFDYDPTPVVSNITPTSVNALFYTASNTILYANKDILNTLYYKDILDKLFSSAGYTWESSIKNEPWFQKIIVLGKTEFSETFNKSSFTYSVEPALHFKYTSNTARISNDVDSVNGVMFNDLSKSQTNVSRIKSNDTIILNSSNTSSSNNRGIGSDKQLGRNDLESLQKRIDVKEYYTGSGFQTRSPITTRPVFFDAIVLDKSAFTKIKMDAVSDVQGAKDFVLDSANNYSLVGNSFIATENLYQNFVTDGYIHIRSKWLLRSGNGLDAPPSTITRPEMKIHFEFPAIYKLKDELTTLDDITHYYTYTTIPAITAASPTTNLTSATFSFRTNYFSAQSGDSVYAQFDSLNSDSRFRFTSDNSLVPEFISTTHSGTTAFGGSTYSHVIEVAYSNASFRSFNRHDIRGLFSFSCDQTIRVTGKIGLDSPYSTGATNSNFKLRFVDVGENGKYYNAMEITQDAEWEMEIIGNGFNEFDFTLDVEKGMNKYALVVMYNENTVSNPSAITLNIKSGSEYKLYSIAGVGATINDNNIYLPDNIKKVDFFSSFLKMFNLYVNVDPSNPQNLLIEPYEKYFNGLYRKLDWTEKLDRTTGVKIEFLTDYLKRKTTLTYSSDSDTGNVSYTDKYKSVYGSKDIINSKNQFLQDEDTIEVLFSPTTFHMGDYWNNCVYPMAGMIIPELKDGSNPRLLFKGDLVNINAIKQPYDAKLISVGFVPSATASRYVIDCDNSQTTTSVYPYVGHVLSLTNSNSKNLNFGDVDTSYIKDDLKKQEIKTYDGYDTLVITNGSRYIVDFSTNLYKEYYSLNYDQIEQSKLITARFYLTEYDIASLQYSDRIILYLNGTNVLCRVNKIKDYNPTEDMTTVVELITLVS
jgi:hypothetical protein